jgi:hypothetical protein
MQPTNGRKSSPVDRGLSPDPLLGDGERGEQEQPDDQAADGQRRCPAGRLGMGEAEDEEEQPAGGQHSARPVHPRAGARLATSQVNEGAGHGYGGEHQVDVQAPAPRQVLREHAAQDQADPTPAGRDRAEHAEGLPPLALVGEGADQSAEGSGRQEGAERALECARGNQHPERDGGASDGRRDRESGQARDEDPLAVVPVTEPAAHEEQAAEGQRVGRHHPLPIAVRKAQRPLGRGLPPSTLRICPEMKSESGEARKKTGPARSVDANLTSQ